MRVLITITIVVFLGLMGPLTQQWTPSAIGVYAVMCVMGIGIVLALWIRRWCNPILRILAMMLAVLMLLSAVSFITAQLRTSGSLFGLRTPIVGFLVIGMPAAVFGITGRPKVENFFGDIQTNQDAIND